MKKIISVIAAAAIAMSLSAPFACADADNLESVLENVKTRVDVPDEYSEFDSSENSYDGTSQYYLEWHTEDYGKSIHLTCYNDGMITSYSRYDGYRENAPHLARMSADEAKSVAEEFVKRINPDYPYECVVADNTSASLYNAHRSFPIEIYINGVYLQNGGGDVTVDTETGSVTGFNIWYTPQSEVTFGSETEFISAADAEDKYAKEFPMELVYRSRYDENNKLVFYPVYTTTDDYDEYIDAVTGERIRVTFYRGDNFLRAGAAGDMGDAEMATASSKALTPKELEEIDNIRGLISKEDIEKKIRGNKTLAVPADMPAENIRLYKDWQDRYMYQLNFMKRDGEYAYINALADALTGEVLQFNRAPVAKYDDSRANDTDFKALAGSKADEYVYDDNSKQYQRYVNGIRVEGDTAQLTYDGDTLASYSINCSDADFPAIDGAESAADAVKAAFGQTEYTPVCVSGYDDNGKSCIYPVYRRDSIAVNPFTLKLVDWNNEEIVDNAGESLTYSDIDGHYAEKYIKELSEYNIGFEGGLFKPDEKITQADLIKLLTSVVSGGEIVIMYNDKEQSDYAYSRAVRTNIIKDDERDDEALITRETASVYLIRAIGAEEYAKYNDIYTQPFEDVTENKGYISLLSAMGVVNGGGDNKFYPDREITRAEFAVMMYNYLNR